jgi:hypothetical protein
MQEINSTIAEIRLYWDLAGTARSAGMQNGKKDELTTACLAVAEVVLSMPFLSFASMVKYWRRFLIACG